MDDAVGASATLSWVAVQPKKTNTLRRLLRATVVPVAALLLFGLVLALWMLESGANPFLYVAG